MITEKQLRDRINNLKKELIIYEEVLNSKSIKKMGRPKGSLKYTEEQIKFIKDNKDVPMKNLIVMFNNQFKTNYSTNTRALYNFMAREGISEWKEEWTRER